MLLVLAAFADGCSALTGVEAIANATPSFRRPRQARARRSEATLGLVLGVLLIGLAVVVQRFDMRPVDGRSLLSLVTQGSLGTGVPYVIVQLATVVLLALAANTSFGGLPVLAAKLSADGYLPHLFGLRADRLVHRYGVGVLAVLLLFSQGQVDVLVPPFAVGVFVGFFLCQVGMVRHWRGERGRGWRWRATVNGTGAVLTAIAALVITITKFPHGAWLVVLMIPLLVLLFTRIHAAYGRIGGQLGIGSLPTRPRKRDTVVRGTGRGDHPVGVGTVVHRTGHGPPRHRRIARVYRELETAGWVSTAGARGTVVASSAARQEPAAVPRSAAAEFAALAHDLGADVDTATGAVRVAYAADRSAALRPRTP